MLEIRWSKRVDTYCHALWKQAAHDFKEIIFRDNEEEYTVNTERQEGGEGLKGPYKSVIKELKEQEDLEMIGKE